MDELISAVREELNPKISDIHARIDTLGEQIAAVNNKIDKHQTALEKLVIALRLSFALDPDNPDTVRAAANRNYGGQIVGGAVRTIGLTAIGVCITGAIIVGVKFIVSHPELLP